jgi:hypothetical protein
MLTDDLKLARARYLLERGRVLNSSAKPQEAMLWFAKAFELASAEKFSRYAIDAVHMMPAQAPAALLALLQDFLHGQTRSAARQRAG